MREMRSCKLEKILRHIFEVLCLMAFVYLFVISLFLIVVNIDDPKWDLRFIIGQNIVKLLVLIISLLGIAFLVRKFIKKRIPTWILAVSLGVITTGISIAWIYAVEAIPWSDFEIVYGVAAAINGKDYSPFGKGAYIYIYPFQLGLITMERIPLAIFGVSYKVLQFTLALFVGLFSISGTFVTNLLSKGNRIALGVYSFLVLTFIPMYAYITAPYGDLPSAALLMFAFWMMLSSFEKLRWWKIVLTSVSVCLALLYRTNSIIVIIGFIIILVFTVWRYKKTAVLLLAGVLLAFAVGEFSMPILYRNQIQEDAVNLPAMTWVNMGMHDETDGWWDSYLMSVLVDSDYNTEKAKAIVSNDTKELIEKYKKNPGKLIGLLHRKAVIQWDSPLIQGFNITLVEFKKEGGLMEKLYTGDLKTTCLKYMDVFFSFLYIMIILGLITGFTDKNKSAGDYLLLIGVFGGFLFTLIWETKTRYALVYIMFLIPYAASYFGTLADKYLFDRIKKLT